MLKPIHLTEKEKQVLIEMYKNNEPVANIGIALGYSGSFIYKQIQEMLEDGSLERRPKVTVSTDRRKKKSQLLKSLKNLQIRKESIAMTNVQMLVHMAMM